MRPFILSIFVVFRDIFLYGIRVPFKFMCYGNDYEHSYYPRAQMPIPGNVSFDNLQALNENSRPLISISSPCDILNIHNCTFTHPGEQNLIQNVSRDKEIYLKTSGNMEVGKGFRSKVEQGTGRIYVDSDLTGLKNNTMF